MKSLDLFSTLNTDRICSLSTRVLRHVNKSSWRKPMRNMDPSASQTEAELFQGYGVTKEQIESACNPPVKVIEATCSRCGQAVRMEYANDCPPEFLERMARLVKCAACLPCVRVKRFRPALAKRKARATAPDP